MIRRLFKRLFGRARRRQVAAATVLVIGLDNAGKTTLLSSLSGGSLFSIRTNDAELNRETVPTIGLDRHTVVRHRRFSLNYFDLGGGTNIRSLWREYFPNAHAVIYLVDSADPARFEESRTVLHEALESSFLASKPILVLANKQDLRTAASASDVAEALEMDSIAKMSYQIWPVCALRRRADRRLRRALDWLVQQIESDWERLNSRVVEDTRKLDEAADEERRRCVEEWQLRQRERELQSVQEDGSAVCVETETGSPDDVGANAVAEVPATPEVENENS